MSNASNLNSGVFDGLLKGLQVEYERVARINVSLLGENEALHAQVRALERGGNSSKQRPEPRSSCLAASQKPRVSEGQASNGSAVKLRFTDEDAESKAGDQQSTPIQIGPLFPALALPVMPSERCDNEVQSNPDTEPREQDWRKVTIADGQKELQDQGLHRGATSPDIERLSQRSTTPKRLNLEMFHSGGSNATVTEAFFELWPVWTQPPAGITPQSTTGSGVRRSTRSQGLDSLRPGKTVVRSGDALMDPSSCMQRFIMRPSSTKRVFWDLASVLVVAYDIIFLPLQVFDPPESFVTEALSRGTTIFWTIDIIASFLAGYHLGGVIEMRPAKVARNYVQTWYVPDMVIIIADWLVTTLDTEGVQGLGILRIGKSLRLMRLLRLLRLLRLFRLLKVMTLFAEFGDVFQSQTSLTMLAIAKVLFALIMVNHFVACGWYWVGTTGGRESWIHEFEERSNRDVGLDYRYATSLHWSFTQFTPASMEVFPTNAQERTYSICILVLACLMFSTFMSSISNSMTHLHKINFSEARHSEMVRRYITDKRVSLELGNRIYAFLRQQRFLCRRPLHIGDVEMFGLMPEQLRVHLHCEVFMVQLLTHPLFSHAHEGDDGCIVNICHFAMSEVYVRTGEELFNNSMKASKMHMLVAGDLEYSHWEFADKPVALRTKDYICEMVVWIKWEYCGRCAATSACELMALDVQSFHNVIAKSTLLPFIQGYAIQYHELVVSVRASGRSVFDIWCEHDALEEMSRRAFDSCESGDIEDYSPKASRPNLDRSGSDGVSDTSKKSRRRWYFWG